ncbi:hypothetical protein LA080_010168 [Diaporthe eres]|nr:hypothetical protein LA080_010168 [Diaporthe eres]
MPEVKDRETLAYDTVSPDTGELEAGDAKYSWRRGVFFNATIVGLAAFAAPGLWNAMQSVGAGGQQTPYQVMAGNAILFATMTFACLTGSIVANRFGLKAALIFGTTGYVLYSAALYANNRYGTVWFIYLGSAACGLSAGIFWAAEGSIMLSYPEPEKRGRYLPYWLAYRNSGSILGGAINLAFNYAGRTTGKLDWRTYIVFVVLLSALAQVFTTLVFGAFLDWTSLSSNRRARYGYIFMMPLIGGCWAWGSVVQVGYSQNKPSLDWDDHEFGRGWAPYIF